LCFSVSLFEECKSRNATHVTIQQITKEQEQIPEITFVLKGLTPNEPTTYEWGNQLLQMISNLLAPNSRT